MIESLQIPMLHHVRYEILHSMVIPKWRDDAPILTEAIFLSFFVHARNLVHFFERERRKDEDDVYSSDFGFPRVSLPIPEQERLRFGKDMMHITTKRERHTSETKPWPIVETYRALKPVATKFTAHILAHYAHLLSAKERQAWQELSSVLKESGDSIVVTEEEAQQVARANAHSRHAAC